MTPIRKYSVGKHLLPVICIVLLQFLPKNGVSLKLYLICIMLWLLVINKGTMRVKKMDLENAYYSLTFFFSLIIHAYGGSMALALSFFGYFVCAPMIIEKRIWNRDDFEKVITIMLTLFTVYAVFGIIEAFTQFNIVDTLFGRTVVTGGANEYRGTLYRGHGSLTVSINNAVFMNMAWAIANYRLCNAKEGRVRWAVVWFIIGLDVILILSRTVIAVGVLVQLLLFRKQGVKWISKRLLVILPILTGFVFLNMESTVLLMDTVKSLFYPIINELFGTSLSVSTGQVFQGSGQRFQLWVWIYESVKDNLLFGKGFTDSFSREFVSTIISGQYAGTKYTAIKTSIEVHWLYVLYQKGLFGLSGFIAFQIGCIKKTMRKGVSVFEEKLSFQYVMIVVTISYFAMLFTCSGSEDLYFFYILMGLYGAYLKICANERSVEKR